MSRSQRICKDCGTEIFVDVNMVMLKDGLWEKICDHPADNICDKDMERRLGRSITEADFKGPQIKGVKIIPCNAMWLEHKRTGKRVPSKKISKIIETGLLKQGFKKIKI